MDPNMKSYADDPSFIRMATRTKELIDKFGLPDEVNRKVD